MVESMNAYCIVLKDENSQLCHENIIRVVKVCGDTDVETIKKRDELSGVYSGLGVVVFYTHLETEAEVIQMFLPKTEVL